MMMNCPAVLAAGATYHAITMQCEAGEAKDTSTGELLHKEKRRLVQLVAEDVAAGAGAGDLLKTMQTLACLNEILVGYYHAYAAVARSRAKHTEKAKK
jgi:hypothetical protein